MDKSPEAFRTISEVADALETPAHVLRFWESRFPQIRPVKRAGGRRYYRPSDVALLAGIKRLLHDEGLTIRGVQKILREQGIRHVAGLGSGQGGLVLDSDAAIEAELTAALGLNDGDDSPPQDIETAQVIALESVLARSERSPAPPPAAATPPAPPSQPDLWSVMDPPPTPDAAPDVPPDAPEAPMAVDVAEGGDSGPAPVETVLPFAPMAPAGDAPAGAAPDAAPDSVDGSDSPDVRTGTEAEVAEAAPTLAARLRGLPPAAVTADPQALAALRDRLRGLRDRLAEASRRRAR